MNRDCAHCAKLSVSVDTHTRNRDICCPELGTMTQEEFVLANYGDCPRWVLRNKVKQ